MLKSIFNCSGEEEEKEEAEEEEEDSQGSIESSSHTLDYSLSQQQLPRRRNRGVSKRKFLPYHKRREATP